MKLLLLLMPLMGLAATPAEFAIQNADKEIAAHPEFCAGYNHRAMALARRARETGETDLYDKAAEAVQRSLALAPANYDGRKASVAVLLARHQWSAALETATELNRQTPDDLAMYGYIADAKIALGDFTGAVDATEWMLRLRAGNAQGLIRAGRLRELYHDWRGALDVLQMAYEATPFAESEERAWILVQMARVNLEAGDSPAAASAADEALKLFPKYYLAMNFLPGMRP